MPRKLYGRQTAQEKNIVLPAQKSLDELRERSPKGTVWSLEEMTKDILDINPEHTIDDINKTIFGSLGHETLKLTENLFFLVWDGDNVRHLPTSTDITKTLSKLWNCQFVEYGDLTASKKKWHPFEPLEGHRYHTNLDKRHVLTIGHMKVILTPAPHWLLGDTMPHMLMRIINDQNAKHRQQTLQNFWAETQNKETFENEWKKLVDDAQKTWDEADAETIKTWEELGTENPKTTNAVFVNFLEELKAEKEMRRAKKHA